MVVQVPESQLCGSDARAMKLTAPSKTKQISFIALVGKKAYDKGDYNTFEVA